MSVRILQLHKRASIEYKFIQDKFAFNEANNSFALADGTTQSYNSEIWAKIVSEEFVTNPSFNSRELISNFTTRVGLYKKTSLNFSSNPAIASLEKAKQQKGGTTTFLGLQFLNNVQFNLICCGDSNFFLLSNDGRIVGFPYSDVDTLDANNFFINTEQLLQERIDETFFQNKPFSCKVGDTIILATDALSRLMLKRPEALHSLLEIKDFDALLNFCLKHWNSKELEEDDISAIIIKVDNKDIIARIVPPDFFSFPEENEITFNPNSIIQKSTTLKFTDMEMQEIKQQFTGVANDFYQVKRKLSFYEILLIVIIGLLGLNLFFVFYFKQDKEKIEQVNVKVEEANSLMVKYGSSVDELTSKIKTLQSQISNLSKPIVKENEDETVKQELKSRKEPKGRPKKTKSSR